MDEIETAVNYFKSGYSCSQSVLAAFGPKLGLDLETALKVASTFGGGIGRTGETCGAITGALMVLGLKYDRTEPEAKENSIKRAREFINKFKTRSPHGVTTCRDLLGHDISTPTGRAFAKENGLYGNCTNLVQYAAEIVKEML